MAKEKNETKTAASVAPQVITDNREQGEPKGIRYVVIRDGHRVSVTEYETQHDPKAIEEVKFWTKVEQKHSWGAPVKVVQYDNKIHRVW